MTHILSIAGGVFIAALTLIAGFRLLRGTPFCRL